MIAGISMPRVSICLPLSFAYCAFALYAVAVIYKVKLGDIWSIGTWGEKPRAVLQSTDALPKDEDGFERRYPVSDDDHEYNDCIARNGVNLVYGPVLNRKVDFKEWKATWIRATFQAVGNGVAHNQLAKCGKMAYNYDRPPGWLGPGKKCTRGHLLGKQLGGNGLNTRNIVMLFNSANSPVMSGWENMIADVRKKMLVNSSRLAGIDYIVKCEYCSGRETPAAVWIETWFKAAKGGELVEWLKILIPNEREVKGIIYVDNSQRLGFGQAVVNAKHNAVIRGMLARGSRGTEGAWKKYPQRLMAFGKRSTRRKRKWQRREELTSIAVDALTEDSPCAWQVAQAEQMTNKA